MAPRSQPSSIEQWELFAKQCLTTRLENQQFTNFSKLLSLRCPVRGSDRAAIFLRPTSKDAEALDPRIPAYIDKLLEIGLVEFHDVLRALLLYSHFHRSNEPNRDEKTTENAFRDWRNPTELDEIILFRVSKAINAGKCPRDFSEALGIIKAASSWMSDVANTSTADQIDQNMTGAPDSLTLEAINVREAVAMLVMTIADNAKITAILRGSCPKGRLSLTFAIDTNQRTDIKRTFAKALSLYIPFLLATSPQSASRLEEFQRQYEIYEAPSANANSSGIDHVIANATNEASQGLSMESLNIVDGPIINSRAGLYIYLNALVCFRFLELLDSVGLTGVACWKTYD